MQVSNSIGEILDAAARPCILAYLPIDALCLVWATVLGLLFCCSDFLVCSFNGITWNDF